MVHLAPFPPCVDAPADRVWSVKKNSTILSLISDEQSRVSPALTTDLKTAASPTINVIDDVSNEIKLFCDWLAAFMQTRGRHHDANYHRQCQATATHYYQSRHNYAIETRLMHVAGHTRCVDTLISCAPAWRTCTAALKHFPPHSTEWLLLIMRRVRLRFLLYTISRTLSCSSLTCARPKTYFCVFRTQTPRERVWWLLISCSWGGS